jgi:hypothetical protein
VQYARRAASIPENQTRQEVEQHLVGFKLFMPKKQKTVFPKNRDPFYRSPRKRERKRKKGNQRKKEKKVGGTLEETT